LPRSGVIIRIRPYHCCGVMCESTSLAEYQWYGLTAAMAEVTRSHRRFRMPELSVTRLPTHAFEGQFCCLVRTSGSLCSRHLTLSVFPRVVGRRVRAYFWVRNGSNSARVATTRVETVRASPFECHRVALLAVALAWSWLPSRQLSHQSTCC
jgi:hypothetical protein